MRSTSSAYWAPRGNDILPHKNRAFAHTTFWLSRTTKSFKMSITMDFSESLMEQNFRIELIKIRNRLFSIYLKDQIRFYCLNLKLHHISQWCDQKFQLKKESLIQKVAWCRTIRWTQKTVPDTFWRVFKIGSNGFKLFFSRNVRFTSLKFVPFSVSENLTKNHRET